MGSELSSESYEHLDRRHDADVDQMLLNGDDERALNDDSLASVTPDTDSLTRIEPPPHGLLLPALVL